MDTNSTDGTVKGWARAVTRYGIKQKLITDVLLSAGLLLVFHELIANVSVLLTVAVIEPREDVAGV